VILGLIDDDQGNFWLISLKGLTKFDPRTETFQIIMRQMDFILRVHRCEALIKRSGGRIYVVVLRDSSHFIRSIHNNPYIPPSWCPKFYLMGKKP